MTDSEAVQEPAESAPLRRAVRALVLAALLLSPVIVLEVWARSATALIPYFQSGYRYQLESKKTMFKQVACPASISMGTSMTETALNAATFEPYARATDDHSFSPVFTFASPGTRPIGMLGVWRWIASGDCVPKTLFVEVNPVILNIDRGEDFERGFMDLRMQLDIPEERFASAPYTIRYRADLATWWRSFAFRNREPILRYLTTRGSRKALRPIDPIPRDGKINTTATTRLEGASLASMYQSTRGIFVRKEFKYRFSPSYTVAIMLLVEEAQSAGTRVVLHTPPVHSMTHEFMGMIDATRPFCDFYNAAVQRPDVHWYSEHRRELPSTEFSDWLHLNQDGAVRYAARLLAAAAADHYPRESNCLDR